MYKTGLKNAIACKKFNPGLLHKKLNPFLFSLAFLILQHFSYQGHF